MEKRSSRRIDTDLNVRICCEPYQYEARVSNISKTGVCIRTTICFPTETECNISIPGENGMIEVQGKVKRITKKEGFNDTMGFELLNPSPDYIEFVEHLRQSL